MGNTFDVSGNFFLENQSLMNPVLDAVGSLIISLSSVVRVSGWTMFQAGTMKELQTAVDCYRAVHSPNHHSPSNRVDVEW